MGRRGAGTRRSAGYREQHCQASVPGRGWRWLMQQQLPRERFCPVAAAEYRKSLGNFALSTMPDHGVPSSPTPASVEMISRQVTAAGTGRC